MATLQKLRNKGAILVGFVGIALFAFIAGDAWKLFQSNSMDASVGTLNGEEISAMDFQEFYEMRENSLKAVSIDGTISNTQREYALQEAWNTFTQLKIAQKQAEKLGIEVTPAEIQHILSSGESVILQHTQLPMPLMSATGTLNLDSLDFYIADYNNNIKSGSVSPKTTLIYGFWKYLEAQITLEAINTKQAKLLQYGKIVNNAVAKSNFELNNYTHSIEIVALPFTSVADSTITVTDEEINNFYEANKEFRYKKEDNTRDIKVIAFQVEPSQADKDALLSEMQEFAKEIEADSANYYEIAMFSQSEYRYDGFLWTKNAVTIADPMTMATTSRFPEDVKARIEAAEVNTIVGPYINLADTTYNLFMNIKKEEVAESYIVRLLAVNSEVEDSLNKTTEELMAALTAEGSDFKEIAKDYPHADSLEFKADEFIRVINMFGTPEIQSEIYNAPVNEYAVIDVAPTSKLIYQVIAKEGTTTAYNTVIIKRPITISTDTYNEAYNNFSQFITSCDSVADFAKDFRSFDLKGISANHIGIGNIPSTRDALKWVLDDNRKAGDISNIIECDGEILMAIAIESVNPKGYVSLNESADNFGTTYRQLIENELIVDKKAELLIGQMTGKSLEELKGNANAKFSTANYVEYNTPATVTSMNVEEDVISAAAANLAAGKESAPIRGNYGVYVIKVVTKESKGNTLDVKNEEFRMAQFANNYRLMQMTGHQYYQVIRSTPANLLQYYVDNYTLQEALDILYPIENKSYIYF